ncbi:MAG: ATP synthase F0 subunit B [Thermodesulfobacteriota bacterium]|nr:MAG: ATP synthase F0 subunit B [Thermodesulfobacteriota bacterium]
MKNMRKGWTGTWFLVVAFSFVAFLITIGGWAGAADEGAVHDTPGVESVHDTATGGGHEMASHGEEGAVGHGEHHGLSHSQVMNFIWHCLNFSILVFFLVKFLRKPIAGALKGRTESIRAGFEELEAKRADAERKYAEYEAKLSTMDEQAKRILKSFTEQGESEKEKIIAQAHEAAERIKAQAEFYVQQELAKAKTELQTEVADMAVKMAEDLIRKNLNEEDHHRLISEYLERVVQRN